jgi:hypothetical protein
MGRYSVWGSTNAKSTLTSGISTTPQAPEMDTMILKQAFFNKDNKGEGIVFQSKQ